VISIDDKQEYDKISEVANSYGDGKAAERIVETLKSYELWEIVKVTRRGLNNA